MAQNEQTLPNAQDFIAAFTSCNLAAQEVSEQLLNGILLDTTHNMVHLVKLLTLQFDSLFKQIQELQVRIETINKAQQEPQPQQHCTRNSMGVENQFSTSQNLYGAQLKVNVKDMKNVINRNIVAEDPEQDVQFAQLLDNNKVNNKILQTLCMAFKFKLFIFNGRTKQKSQQGENDEKIIRIFHIRNKYSLFKIQSGRIQQKKNHVSNTQKYQNQNPYKGNNYMNNGKNFSQQSLINTIKQVVKEVISEKGNQPNWKQQQQQQQFSQDPQVYDQEEIFCQKCGSGPYASAQFYRSHIHFKHDGKTPSKNKFHKNLDLMGIEVNGLYQIPIKQDENILDNKNQIKLISWNVGSLKQSTFEIIKQETVHLLCLQEVRNQYISDSVKYKYYYNKRDTSNSGGIIIGVHKQFQSKNITTYILPEVLVVQIINPILNLVLINVYFHNQCEYKKCRQYYCEKVTEIVNQISNNQQLVICGDFNYEDLGVGFMIVTAQDKITFRRKQLHRTLSSVTDHILILREVNYSASQMWKDSYDHCILRLEFQANSHSRSK